MNQFLQTSGLFALEDSVDKIPVDQLRRFYCEMLRDHADDDTEIRKLAARVLPEIDVEGDSYGVPGVVTIVESLVIMIEYLKLQRNWDEFDKSREK